MSTMTTLVDRHNSLVDSSPKAGAMYSKDGLLSSHCDTYDFGDKAQHIVTDMTKPSNAPATTTTANYDNVQRIAEVLLLQIQYVSQLQRQLEAQGNTSQLNLPHTFDSLAPVLSSFPAIPNVLPQSPDPALLPV